MWLLQDFYSGYEIPVIREALLQPEQQNREEFLQKATSLIFGLFPMVLVLGVHVYKYHYFPSALPVLKQLSVFI